MKIPNPPSLYERCDTAIMNSTNALVRAYNWATGRTKDDFANVIDIFSVPLNVIAFGMVHPIAGITAGIWWGSCVYTGCQRREKQREIESKTHINESDNQDLVAWRKRDKKGARAYLLIGVLEGIVATGQYFAVQSTSDERQIEAYMTMQFCLYFGLGCLMNSAARYIMTADSVQPRKNCIRRGIEHYFNHPSPPTAP